MQSLFQKRLEIGFQNDFELLRRIPHLFVVLIDLSL